MAIDVNPNEEFHTVIEGQVMALSLDQLDNLYQRDVIQDESLIWQPGLGEWMRLDTVLYELAQQEEPPAEAAPADDDVFHVMVADDDLKQMTLEQLDDAYRLDIIDLETLVWQQGYSEWIPLGVLLGQGEEEHVSIAPSMPAAAPPGNPFLALGAPVEPFSLAPSAIPPGARVLEPAPSVAPVPSMLPAATSSVPPSLAPLSPVSVPNSIAAVQFELPPPQPKKSKWIARSYTVLAAAAALFVMHQNGVTQAVVGTAAAQQLGIDTNTPHGIESWLASVEQKYQLDQLTETAPVRPPEAKPTLKKVPLPSDESAEASAEKGKTDADSKSSETTSKKPAKAVKSFGAALSGKPAPRAKAPRRHAPARQKSKSGSANLPSTANAYDPMNGTL